MVLANSTKTIPSHPPQIPHLPMYIEHTVVPISRGRPQRIPYIFGSYGEAIDHVRRKIRRAAHTASYKIYRKNELVLEVFHDMDRCMDRGKYA